jgi:hypothetical protein
MITAHCTTGCGGVLQGYDSTRLALPPETAATPGLACADLAASAVQYQKTVTAAHLLRCCSAACLPACRCRDGLAVAAAGNGRCVGRDCATVTKCKKPHECRNNYCVCFLGPVDHMDADPNAPGGGVVHVPSSLSVIMPDCVIAVAAVDQTNMLAPFSNFGAGVRIVAPGVNITSDLPVAGTDMGFGVISGTSVVSIIQTARLSHGKRQDI